MSCYSVVVLQSPLQSKSGIDNFLCILYYAIKYPTELSPSSSLSLKIILLEQCLFLCVYRSQPASSNRPLGPVCVRETPLQVSALRVKTLGTLQEIVQCFCLTVDVIILLFPLCFQPQWTVHPWWCQRWLIRTRPAPQRTCAPWRSRALTPPLTARPTPPPLTEAAPAWNSVHVTRRVATVACLTWMFAPVTPDTVSLPRPRSLWNALQTGLQRTSAIRTRRTPQTTHTPVRNTVPHCTYVTSSPQPNIYQRSRPNHRHTPSLKHEWWAGSSCSLLLSPHHLSLVPPPQWPPLVELQPSALWLFLPPLPLRTDHAAPGCVSVFGLPLPHHNPPLPRLKVATRPQRGLGCEQPGGTASWHASSAPPVTLSPAPLLQEVSVARMFHKFYTKAFKYSMEIFLEWSAV